MSQPSRFKITRLEDRIVPGAMWWTPGGNDDSHDGSHKGSNKSGKCDNGSNKSNKSGKGDKGSNQG